MDRKYNPWHALRVRARFEKLVATKLSSRGFEVFFPTYVSRREQNRQVRSIELPLFAGYVFARIPAGGKTDVLLVPGVLHLLGPQTGQESLAEKEMTSLQTIIRSSFHYEASPFVTSGPRVRVLEGPLCDVEGIKVDERASRLALGVSLVGRSVLVDLEKGIKVASVYHTGLATISVPA